MTDNEIIKALEEYEVVCDECACNEGDMTGKKIMLNALDIIKRQKAEIERLKKGWEADVIETQHIKAEAIKEFVEKLKEHACFYDLDNYHSFEAIDIDNIDDLVKEMVGEDNE